MTGYVRVKILEIKTLMQRVQTHKQSFKMGEYELEHMNMFVSTTNVEFSFKLWQPQLWDSMNVNHCYNIIEWKN